ncbi:hypothetical protein D1224_05090 [Henriciella barbarensis]|uniref:Uncharacterized protein n=1 Tax=Henriciella barbarensis TaxID=86342 RepID=A0A399QXI6_9PROT|nr:hypothetical protein [Henriciella barbarensis]RIJ23638.1 hypothetical protein D1224_05090 [Henriciella barbarensis]
METGNEKRVQRIWNQGQIPVLLRRSGKGEKPRLRLPYEKPPNNRNWLQNGRRSSPSWNQSEKYWEIPKAWFNDTVERALLKFNSIYVIQPYRELEICAPACRNAKGHECQCSCMGANHGQGEDGTWFDISDAFSVRWNNSEIACRLMTKK